MTSTLRFSALQIPLRGGWRLDLRRKGVAEEPTDCPFLPKGWSGISEDAGPIGWSRRVRGSSVLLNETMPLVWEIFHPDPKASPWPEIETHPLFARTSRAGQPPRGDFQAVNVLGLVEIFLRFGSDRQRLTFEVVSAKFSHERDFERMTSDIARHCQQLLLEWNTPSGLPFSTDPEKRRRLLLEQFLFLSNALSDHRLERWMESVRNRPHSRLEREAQWRPAALARSSDFLCDPLRMARDWRLRKEGGFRPGEVLDARKRDDRDTPPNRFLRHALESFDAVCREVVRQFPPDGGPARSAALELSARISSILGGSFFREISPPTRLALENQTLQKREGYRDVLRVWLLLEQAARLEWDGRSDVFNATTRDVATLYEYWLFFELLEILTTLPNVEKVVWGADEGGPVPVFCQNEGRLRIQLRRGRTSLLVLESSEPGRHPLRVHFYFDRSYSPADAVLASGAYSRPFRPDFSLVVFPSSFADDCGPLEAESAAEKEGRIAYLHFDAKYRVDSLREIFGTGGEEDLREEESAKATNSYKRADLFKMHAYNDAIRRTVGSYVLYPGLGPTQEPFRKYHEILPGVGAFSLSPGDPNRRMALREFLVEALRSQTDRFTQLARVNYWTHDTVREEPVVYEIGGAAHHTRPPKDSGVVLGFLRAGEDPTFWRSKQAFYCHAVEWDKAADSSLSRQPGKPTHLGFDPLRADWLALEQKQGTLPWLAKVLSVKIVSASERAVELHRDIDSMGAAYYYRFQLGEIHTEPPRDVSSIVPQRRGHPIFCTLAELAQCPVLHLPAATFSHS